MITRVFVFVVAGVMLCAADMSAQSVSPQVSDEWQLEVVPYLWGSGMEGEVGIGDHTADVDASFRNILSHLHLAAMGLIELRRDRMVAVTDLIYTDLRGQHATPGPLFSSVDPEQKLVILTSEGGYRIMDTDGASVDVVGGVRYWHLNSRLQFEAGLSPEIDLQASRNWVDAIGGMRARSALGDKWWVNAYGDVGGGGSGLTYQLVGTVGWDIGTRYALVTGYRYLSVDYDNDGVLLDNAMKGPLFGFTIKW